MRSSLAGVVVCCDDARGDEKEAVADSGDFERPLVHFDPGSLRITDDDEEDNAEHEDAEDAATLLSFPPITKTSPSAPPSGAVSTVNAEAEPRRIDNDDDDDDDEATTGGGERVGRLSREKER